MDKNLSKRLAKLIPEGGGFDISFNLGSSGQAGKVASTLSLVVFGPASEGKNTQILKKISIPSIQDNIELANKEALENALTLLGV
jgi:hypothetical protein